MIFHRLFPLPSAVTVTSQLLPTMKVRTYIPLLLFVTLAA